MARGRFNGRASTESSAKDTRKESLPDLSKMADTDKVTVVSENRAGKTVMGIGEKPVAFDEDGKAEVTAKEAKYFLTIPGFELDGAAAESENGGSEDVSDLSSENAGNGADSERAEENKADSENVENEEAENKATEGNK